jgi:hypothetical protein
VNPDQVLPDQFSAGLFIGGVDGIVDGFFSTKFLTLPSIFYLLNRFT